jgi:hypothetical protein
VVVSKALGRKYGVAKEATLIWVKQVKNDPLEVIESLRLVIDDLNKPGNEERRLKSVINLSAGYRLGLNHDTGGSMWKGC